MSDLALQLIAENKRSRDTFLDLGNCGLTEVPAEVGELVWLESLSLVSGTNSRNTADKNNRLIDIGPLGGLTRLRSLIVAQVADLALLASLTKLQTLYVSDTQVSDLTPLAGLSALQSLDVSNTQVSNLTPLAGLSAQPCNRSMSRARRSVT